MNKTSSKDFLCKWCKKEFVSGHNLEKHVKLCKIKKQVEDGESVEERELRDNLAKLEVEKQQQLQKEKELDVIQESTIEELRVLLTSERTEKEEFQRLLHRERAEKDRLLQLLTQLQNVLGQV